jgi:hypothetical protein
MSVAGRYQIEVICHDEAAELRDLFLPPAGTHITDPKEFELAVLRLVEAAKALRRSRERRAES